MPSVLIDGAITSSAFWNSLIVWYPVVAIEVASAPNRLNVPSVLVGRAHEDLLDRGHLLRLHARAARQRRVERRHAPVVPASRGLVGAGIGDDHHRVRAAGDRLRDGAGRMPPSAITWQYRLDLVLMLAASGRGVGDRLAWAPRRRAHPGSARVPRPDATSTPTAPVRISAGRSRTTRNRPRSPGCRTPG